MLATRVVTGDDWSGDAWAAFLANYRVSRADGLWLADATDLSPLDLPRDDAITMPDPGCRSVERLAYQIQAAALGGIDKATLRVIRQPKGQTPDSRESRLFEARIPTTREGPIREREQCWSVNGKASWKG